MKKNEIKTYPIFNNFNRSKVIGTIKLSENIAELIKNICLETKKPISLGCEIIIEKDSTKIIAFDICLK